MRKLSVYLMMEGEPFMSKYSSEAKEKFEKAFGEGHE